MERGCRNARAWLETSTHSIHECIGGIVSVRNPELNASLMSETSPTIAEDP